MDIKGAVAIVTGGASGLGEATAARLAEAGSRVVVVDRDVERGREVAKSLDGVFVEADVASEEQVQRAVDAGSELGALRILVNCAGIGRVGRTLDREGAPLDLKSFDRVLRINLLGTFNCIRLAAARMAQTDALADGERGAIVNTASVAAFDGQIGQAAYAASKAGIAGMTLPIARDLAVVGVRVNTIAPGLFDTPIYGTGPKAESFKESLASSVVFPRRLGMAHEFASLAVELARNSYLNAEVVRIDGGARMPPK